MRTSFRFPWTLLAHIAFWAGYFLIVSFIFRYLFAWQGALARTLTMGVFHALLVYVHLQVVWPRYFTTRKYVAYAGTLLVSLVVYIMLRAIADYSLIWFYPWLKEILLTPRYWAGILFTGVVMLLITSPFRLVELLGLQMQAEEQLRSLRLEAEIRQLKAQFQPHFLFNTLNNLYTLALTGSPKTADAILRLSGLMRYAMESGEAETVALAKEWEMVSEFVAISSLRYEEKVAVVLEDAGDLDKYHLPPLILLPFIENAFKHGNLGEDLSAFIHVSLQVFSGGLTYEVKNSYTKEKGNLFPPSGRGLTQLRQRLDLVFGPSFQMITGHNKDHFESRLTILLSSESGLNQLQDGNLRADSYPARKS